MPRRALLIFAEDAKLDLARRGLPVAALPLLRLPAFEPARALAVDVHVFSSRPAPECIGQQFHEQRGRGFRERFENAIETAHSLGYDEIVAVGRDCPNLRASDIALAFAQLGRKRLVLGPDHRGGCYLIGFRTVDRALLRGIRWKRNTDCAELRTRCGESAVFLLPVKHDLDSWVDLRLLARWGDAAGRLAAFLLQTSGVVAAKHVHFVDLAAQSIRVRGQMPPPAFVG